MLARDNPFWQFSLAIYAEPGVAAECLALQDSLDLDVNALLFCAWLGAARKIVLGDEDMTTIDAHSAMWRDIVVRPLRTIRQGIKAMPAMAEDAVNEFRSDIARIELRAEQIEQAMLFELTKTSLAALGPGAGGETGAHAIHETHAVHGNVTRFIARHRIDGHPAMPASAPKLVAAALAYGAR